MLRYLRRKIAQYIHLYIDIGTGVAGGCLEVLEPLHMPHGPHMTRSHPRMDSSLKVRGV